ncbi:MAG: DUF2281 domain-containing protein [Pyrinomonadaceae bacterium]
MSTEHIANRLERLPPSLQREVLDFIEFLSQKVANGEAVSEDAAWQRFSLAQAMKGLDDEESPEYSEADLKERWR